MLSIRLPSIRRASVALLVLALPAGAMDRMAGSYLGPEYTRKDVQRTASRHGAPHVAYEDFDAKYEKWQGNYMAAIQQQAGPQLQPQPQEKSTMSNNQQQTQQQTLNRENEQRKARSEQMRRLQEARRQQEQEQEQELSCNNSFGQEM